MENIFTDYEVIDNYLVNTQLKTIGFMVLYMYGADQSHYTNNEFNISIRMKLEHLNITHVPSVDHMIMDYKYVNSDLNKSIKHWRGLKFIDAFNFINDGVYNSSSHLD